MGFFKDYCSEIMRAENIRPETALALTAAINWALPSITSTAEMGAQEALLNASLNASGVGGIGLVCTRALEQSKGLLYKTAILDTYSQRWYQLR